MKKSIFAESPRSCTGCSACMTVCPADAISIVQNHEGFYSASVDNEKCVDCGLCQTVCSRFISPDSYSKRMVGCPVVGSYSISSEVQNSTTSGGIAYELSKWGLEHGYQVFGVQYNYDNDEAQGILINRVEDLELLKGSKYLQANISSSLSILMNEARKNPSNKYICIGTPCQIFGIRQLIERKKLNNDFLLIDLFCHGVPSYNIWKPYIADIHKRIGTFKKVNFRYKGNGWHQYTIRIEGEKDTYQEFAYKDTFYRFFFDNIVLNTACFTCEMRKQFAASDLRLGDFLGKAYEHREDGISAALIVTEKGKLWMEKVWQDNRIVLDKYWDTNICLAAQSTLDYQSLDLRNEVICHISSGMSLSKVLHWYTKKLPIKRQILSILKQVASSLPIRVIILLRRIYR